MLPKHDENQMIVKTKRSNRPLGTTGIGVFFALTVSVSGCGAIPGTADAGSCTVPVGRLSGVARPDNATCPAEVYSAYLDFGSDGELTGVSGAFYKGILANPSCQSTKSGCQIAQTCEFMGSAGPVKQVARFSVKGKVVSGTIAFSGTGASTATSCPNLNVEDAQ